MSSWQRHRIGCHNTGRDVVQPPVFVSAAPLNRKLKKPCSHLVTWRPVAPGIKPGETQNLCFVDYTKCRSTLLTRNVDQLDS